MRRGVALLVALTGMAACTTSRPVPRTVPPPTTPSARPAPAPSTPSPPASIPAPPTPAPPPLSPQMSAEQERSMVEATQASIGATDRVLRSLERRIAGSSERETFLTAQGFLDQARKALAMREVQRASMLASKARVLTDDLAARFR